MAEDPKSQPVNPGADLGDDDIYEAMKEVSGYLDITSADFREVYHLAYRKALARLSRTVTARQIMTRDVVAVRPDTPLDEVAARMGERWISGVPVVDDAGKVLGMISEKDFLARMGAAEPRNFMTLVANCLRTRGCVALPMKQETAGDLMSSPAVTVTLDTPVKEIAELFTRRRINRVAVVDEGGLLKGIVTRGDLIRATTLGA